MINFSSNSKKRANVLTAGRVHIVLDNLRVGGIQRLALDEAYSLSRTGKIVSVLVLEELIPTDDMREIDSLFFHKHHLEILFLPKGRRRQINWFARYLRKRKPHILLCHSAKSVWIIRLAALLSLQKVFIVCFLHQIASLSSNVQRAKRFILFCLANQIRASSKQFILEFEIAYRRLNFMNRWVLKKIHFDRMGIDLSRIEWIQNNYDLIPVVNKPALIFNSRLTEWKGFETFLHLAEFLGTDFQYILITTRMGHQNEQLSSFNCLPTAKIFYGKSVPHFYWNTPSVHVYPTNYGQKVKYPQNVGLNVLECLALGIPSIISVEGFETWPEFRGSEMIYTTNWTIEESSKLVKEVLLSPAPRSLLSNETLRGLVGIDQHLMRLQELFQLNNYNT